MRARDALSVQDVRDLCRRHAVGIHLENPRDHFGRLAIDGLEPEHIPAIPVEGAGVVVAVGKRDKVFHLIEFVRHRRDGATDCDRLARIVAIVIAQVPGLDPNTRIGGPELDVVCLKILEQLCCNLQPRADTVQRMAKDDIDRSGLNFFEEPVDTGLCGEDDFADVFIAAGQLQLPAVLPDEGLRIMKLRFGTGGVQRAAWIAQIDKHFLLHGTLRAYGVN